MKHLLLLLFFLTSSLSVFAQKGDFRHVDGLYLFLKNKQVKKINPKMPIQFIFSDVEDGINHIRIVTGFIKKFTDSTHFEVLPVKIIEKSIAPRNKTIFKSEKLLYSGVGEIEFVDLEKYNTIKYQSKWDKRTSRFFKGASFTSGVLAFISIPFLENPNENQKGVNVVTSKFLFLGSIFLYLPSIVFDPAEYLVYNCEKCEKKSKVYNLKIIEEKKKN